MSWFQMSIHKQMEQLFQHYRCKESQKLNELLRPHWQWLLLLEHQPLLNHLHP